MISIIKGALIGTCLLGAGIAVGQVSQTVMTPQIAQTTSNNGQSISLDQAKEIALNNAGFTESDVTFIRSYTEFDDGFTKINVKFYHGTTEYEYEIDLVSRAILESNVDPLFGD